MIFLDDYNFGKLFGKRFIFDQIFENTVLTTQSELIFIYLLSSLGGLLDTGVGRIVLYVTHAYASEYMIKHNVIYVYARVSKGPLRVVRRYRQKVEDSTRQMLTFLSELHDHLF